MKYQLSLILWGLLLGFSSLAQEDKRSSFTAQITYDTVGLEEQFEVKYTLKNATAVALFETPTFEGLHLLTGPMTSQSMTIINGDMTQSMTYTFLLKANHLGLFIIPANSLETEEGILITEEIVLVVVEEIDRPKFKNPSNAYQDPFSNNPFFNDPFFNQGNAPRQRMDDMMKGFDKMFKFDPPSLDFELGPNGQPLPPVKKKPKKEEKVYKI